MIYPQSDHEFQQATDWYGSIIANELTLQKDKSKAHLRLGLIYSHYRNPSLDYERALQHVETSISLLNGAAPDDSVINLRNLLNSITGIDISSLPALLRLNKENIALMSKNKDLANENAELRKTLEKLNELEVELEKKRREIR